MVVVPNGMLVFLMLLFGTWNTINTKVQFQTCVPTSDKEAAKKSTTCPDGQVMFNKPWQVNQYMFIGEASLLIVDSIQSRTAKKNMAPPMADGRDIEAPAKVAFYLFAVPAFCDVFGSGLALVSQIYLDPAVWQMLRSAIIPFSALFSVFFLGRKIQFFRWVGVAIVMAGLIIVAVSSMLDAGAATSTSTPAEQLLGAALTVAATLCTAFQMVFEEKLLTGREVCSAKKVVGGEGMWGGLFLMVGLLVMNVVPGKDNGVYEALPDGLHMVGSSPLLLFLAITFTMSIAIYNLTGITVGKKLSSVVRCMVDSCRTVTVWVSSLALYYLVDEQYGAKLSPHWWLMMIGFAILTLGTLIYNDILPVPESWRGEDDPKDVSLALTESFLVGSRVCSMTVEEENSADTAQTSLARCPAGLSA